MIKRLTLKIVEGHDAGLNPSAVKECVEALEEITNAKFTFIGYAKDIAKQALEKIKGGGEIVDK